mmetsp:Transcript_130627/g.291562  ORF Transcript_130627/g.291562 Transcript_130627/m.291562 type:complete len:213 (-) Transcript_130627:419-1057(-)
MALAPRADAVGDELNRFLLPLAYGDAHWRRVLVLDGDQAIAGHDGDALPTASNAESAFGHPSAYAPMHRHGVEVLGPLLAAAALHMQQLREILEDVFHLHNVHKLYYPSRRGLRGVQAFRVEVHRLLRHSKARLLTDAHLSGRSRPDWRRVRVAEGEHHGALFLLRIALLVLHCLYFHEGQMPLRALALEELRLPSLVPLLDDVLLHNITLL